MGIVSDTDRKVKAFAAGRANTYLQQSNTRNVVSVTDKETLDFIRKFPAELRRQVLTKATRRAGRVMINAARAELASKRSKVTGSRKKWSQSTQDKRRGGQDLWQSIGQKVRVYEKTRSVAAFVGPRRPWGRHGHLVELGGYHYLWGGKKAGLVGGDEGGTVGMQVYEPPFPFMRRAHVASLYGQRRAFQATVYKEWQKV